MRRTTVIGVVMALAAVGGCSTLGKQAFQQPIVNVSDIKLTGIGLTGGSMDVYVNVQNPNDFRLDATRMTYNVVLDTVPFANGTVDSRFTVEGKKTAQVRVPVNFTYAGIGQAGRQLLNTGGVNYKLTGDVTVGTVVGNFTVPYNTTGRLTNFGFNR